MNDARDKQSEKQQKKVENKVKLLVIKVRWEQEVEMNSVYWLAMRSFVIVLMAIICWVHQGPNIGNIYINSKISEAFLI